MGGVAAAPVLVVVCGDTRLTYPQTMDASVLPGRAEPAAGRPRPRPGLDADDACRSSPVTSCPRRWPAARGGAGRRRPARPPPRAARPAAPPSALGEGPPRPLRHALPLHGPAAPPPAQRAPGSRSSGRGSRASGSSPRRSAGRRGASSRAARRRVVMRSTPPRTRRSRSNHSPAPDRSQCSRVAPHVALTRTGTPAVSASTTVREKDSCGEGATSARAPRSSAHLRVVVDHAGHDDVARRAPGHRPPGRRRPGAADRGGAPCRRGSSATACPSPSGRPPGRCRRRYGIVRRARRRPAARRRRRRLPRGRLLHTETDEHLGGRRHAEALVDQRPLAPAVEREAASSGRTARRRRAGAAPAPRARPGATRRAPRTSGSPRTVG